MITVDKTDWETLLAAFGEICSAGDQYVGSVANDGINLMTRIESQPSSVTIDPALVDEMIGLVRTMRESQSTNTLDYITAGMIADKLPKPVDPDLIKAREWLADQFVKSGGGSVGQDIKSGGWDDHSRLTAYLAGLKAR